MFFPWRQRNFEETREIPVEVPAVRFHRATLSPAIAILDLTITKGSWVHIEGEDDLGIALFCDLCFGFVRPEEGTVSPHMNSTDVNFLGRSATTYGRTLLDHITCATNNISKAEILSTTNAVFTKNFFQKLTGEKMGLQQFNSLISNSPLMERDYMEIAEVNLLLQHRHATVIDTTAAFYQSAIDQGFRHSEQFLSSPKTIFWILKRSLSAYHEYAPWNLNSNIQKVKMNFPKRPRKERLN